MEPNHSQEINNIIKNLIKCNRPFATYKNHYGNSSSWFTWKTVATNGIARFYDTYWTNEGHMRRIKYVLNYKSFYSNNTYEALLEAIIDYCDTHYLKYTVYDKTIVIRYVLKK